MTVIQNRLQKLINNISKDFILEKLSKSPARFDVQKLTWFNRQYISMMSLDEFVTRAFELKSTKENYLEKLDRSQEFKDVDIKLFENVEIPYPLWKVFCKSESIFLVDPSEIILRQYLAWQLDKNRVSLLTEIGSESDCILGWQKPNAQTVTWKKITLNESLENLKKIQIQIENLYTIPELNLKSKQAELYLKVKNEIYFETEKEIEVSFNQLTLEWEVLLKTWIAENGFDAGSFFWPLRVALSGKSKSPSPFEILAILPLKEVVDRIELVVLNS